MRPNILYIHSHDSGRYLQPFGQAVPTPNIQRLAEQGVLFRQAFSVAPTCSPSRAGLLTGMCPHSAGMTGLAHRGWSLNDYRQHLVHTLRGAGYRTTLIGVQHEAARPEMIGYDEVVPLKSEDAVDVAPAAVAFLDQAPQQPFFLSVGFAETHRPYHQAGPQEDPRYTLPPAPLPDTPETRRDMADFKASARILDEGMGRVLAALDRNGLAENTLVICTTDHGIAFPMNKCNLTQHGLGVSLILRGPGGLAGGRVCDALVSQIDVFPTLCELLAIQPPAWLQGRSLLPLIRGEADEINDAVYGEVTYHAAYEPMRTVRTKRYSYIRRFGERKTPVLPNLDDSPSKALWLASGWAEQELAAEQLYDLILDPTEAHNIAGEPRLAGVLADMRARLEAWMRRTNDPLLQGEPVPAPAGAVMNPVDGVSPRDEPIPAVW
ncbi:MAG: sulfatase [Anaerolineales bacterium]